MQGSAVSLIFFILKPHKSLFCGDMPLNYDLLLQTNVDERAILKCLNKLGAATHRQMEVNLMQV